MRHEPPKAVTPEQRQGVTDLGLWGRFRKPGVDTMMGNLLNTLPQSKQELATTITGAKLTAARKRERRNRREGRRQRKITGQVKR